MNQINEALPRILHAKLPRKLRSDQLEHVLDSLLRKANSIALNKHESPFNDGADKIIP